MLLHQDMAAKPIKLNYACLYVYCLQSTNVSKSSFFQHETALCHKADVVLKWFCEHNSELYHTGLNVVEQEIGKMNIQPKRSGEITSLPSFREVTRVQDPAYPASQEGP